MIGRRISQYIITDKIGEGGMGVVYKAKDVKLSRCVALKFLPQHFQIDSTEHARFNNEAQLISSLNHPNIATIYNLEEWNGNKFIVMEYIDGGTLKDRITSGPLSYQEILEYSVQITEGLAHAHKYDIVHRDIKSDNVMVTSEGRIKITDFGLAKLRGTGSLTKSGVTVGRAPYMSPEQAMGEAVDFRSDLFSLGVILYELIAGKLPFKGEYEAALLYEIVHQSPTPLHKIRTDVPTELEYIVGRLIEKDKNNRYQNAGDLLTDLILLKNNIPTEQPHKKKFKMRRLDYKTIIIICIILTVIFSVLIYEYFDFFSKKREVPSLAILYIKNLGQEEDEVYSYGIVQDLIVDIAKAGNIRVAPIKDVLSIDNQKLPINEIAKQLHVRYIFDGTLKRSGESFQLAAQIFDVSTGTTIWTDRIQTNQKAMSNLQGNIAKAIISTLKLKPSNIINDKITQVKTTNPDAYEYYLRANYLVKVKKKKSDIIVAQGLYEKAIAIDSAFVSPRIGLGYMHELQGDYNQAKAIYNKAVTDARMLRDSLTEGEALNRLGVILWNLGDLNNSESYYHQSLEIFKKIGNKNGINMILNNLGALYNFRGDNAKALEYYNSSLEILITLDDKQEESRLLNNMATSYAEIGRYADAIESFERSLKLRREFSDKRGEGVVLENLGILMNELGNYSEAETYLTTALSIHYNLGNKPWEASTYGDFGQLYQNKGDISKSLEYYQKSLEIIQPIGEKITEGAILMSMGEILLNRNNLKDARDTLQRSIIVLQSVNENRMEMQANAMLTFLDILMADTNNIRQRLINLENDYEIHSRKNINIQTSWYLYRSNKMLGDNVRARKFLNNAYEEINKRLENISNQKMKTSYMYAVPRNRDIVNAWVNENK